LTKHKQNNIKVNNLSTNNINVNLNKIAWFGGTVGQVGTGFTGRVRAEHSKIFRPKWGPKYGTY